MTALAADIGGTKLAAAVVSESGEILGRGLTPTPRTGDASVVFAALTSALDSAIAQAGYDDTLAPSPFTGIGVATAGPLDIAAGTVSPVNIAAWRGFPLREKLAERYRLPVRMFGDAVAVTVAEHWLGAARGRENVLGMVVSTGVGGGLILGGRVLAGATGNAGHIGHMSVDADGPTCPCGGVGCLEVLASGTAIGSWAAAHTADRATPLTTAAEVADAARAGDEIALAALHRAGDALGMAIAGAVTLLDLDVVVIGGGVMKSWDLIEPAARQAYARHARLGYATPPRVEPAELGGDAGVLGAAGVILRAERYWPW